MRTQNERIAALTTIITVLGVTVGVLVPVIVKPENLPEFLDEWKKPVVAIGLIVLFVFLYPFVEQAGRQLVGWARPRKPGQ